MSDQPREYPKEFYERLLFYAEADLWNAEQSLQKTSEFWHIPCFAARESAEKSLKAFLEAAGKEVGSNAAWVVEVAPRLHGCGQRVRAVSIPWQAFGEIPDRCPLP